MSDFLLEIGFSSKEESEGVDSDSIYWTIFENEPVDVRQWLKAAMHCGDDELAPC